MRAVLKKVLDYESSTPSGNKIVMVDAINHALHEEIEKNPDMYIFGEDIEDAKGGVFTATKGLSTRFTKKEFSIRHLQKPVLWVLPLEWL